MRLKASKVFAQAAIVVALSAFGAYGAQLPDPFLGVVNPCGGRAGESVQMTLTGTALDEAAPRFSHAGIVAKADPKDAKKFAVSIAADVPPGRYDVRAVGKNGVSNPRVFEVSAATETPVSTKNLDRENAQAVTLPCVIFGAAQSQRTYWFKITAVKGRPLSFDCHAAQLDSRFVPLQVLFDANGYELERARETPLEWLPTEDGALYLSLRDYLANGGAEHFFRLYLTELTGEAAPPVPRETPLLFWPLGDKPMPEVEPNDLLHPRPIVPPCEIGGQFFPAGDVDCFKFEAKKGDVWWMEVVSQRLGLPTNPRLIVERLVTYTNRVESAADVLELNDGPAVPGAPDFDGAHLDPIGKFEAKDDGTYRIQLRDLNNNGGDDPRRRYTLSIRKAAPDFALVAIPVPPTDNKPGAKNDGPVITVRAANIRPGETLPVRVIVLRRDGFNGEIVLSAENLPKGVRCIQTAVSGETQDTTIFLQTSADAQPWSGAINVVGTHRKESVEIVRKARVATPVWNSTVGEFVEPARWRYASEFALSVLTDTLFPVAVNADPKPVEAAPNAKAKFSFKIARNAEFKEMLKLKPVGVAGLDKAKEVEIAAKATTAEYELDLAPLKLTPGTYTLWFRGQDKGKVTIKGKAEDYTVTVFSTPAVLVIKDAKDIKKGAK